MPAGLGHFAELIVQRPASSKSEDPSDVRLRISRGVENTTVEMLSHWRLPGYRSHEHYSPAPGLADARSQRHHARPLGPAWS
jgi:hypothetical protein